MFFLLLTFSSFTFLLLKITLVEILRLVQGHLVRDELRKRSNDGDENFLLNASDSFVALSEAIKGANGDITGHNHEGGGLLGLGHSSEDEHGGDSLEVNTGLSVFKTHAVREVAAESLGTTVGTEVRGGHETIRRGDGDDSTSLGFAHAGEDEVGEAEDRLAVDVEDVDFLTRFKSAEGLVVGVRETDVVDEDGDVELGEFLEELLVFGFGGGGEVESDGLSLDLVLGFEVGAQVFEDVLTASDNSDVEAALGEFGGVCFTDTGGGTSDDSPVAGLSILGFQVGLDEEVEADEADELEGDGEEDDGADEFEDALAADGHICYLLLYFILDTKRL